MLSAYSWWDLTKIVLAVLALYYAYVGWRYYREEIWEWVTNRGQKPQPDPAVSTAAGDDEDDASSLYTVHTNHERPAGNAHPVLASNDQLATAAPQTVRSTPVDLPEGQVIEDDKSGSLDMPVIFEIEQTQDESLSQLTQTAQHLTVDADGVVSPSDPTDEKAVRLAAAVNQQNGHLVFGGVPFNR